MWWFFFFFGLRRDERLVGYIASRGAALQVFAFLVTLSHGTTPACLHACATFFFLFPPAPRFAGGKGGYKYWHEWIY